MWKRGRRKSTTLEPPSAGELIAYLDGQLPRERRAEVQALLEGSWELRSQLADIERDTKLYIDASSDEFTGPFPSPDEIRAGIRAKLRERTAAAHNPAVGHTAALVRRILRNGIPAAAAVLLVAAFFMTRPRTITASTIVDRGRSMEATLLRTRATPVLHQRLQVRKEGKNASWQIWSAPTKGRYAESVGGDNSAVQELKSIRAKNRMDPQRPLSAGAYGEWRRTVSVRSESVTPDRTENGESGYRIDLTVAAPEAPEAILSSSLLVRGSDWRPVSEHLTVRSEDHEEHYEIREIGYEVVAYEQLSPSAFETNALAAIPATKVPAKASLPPAIVPNPAQFFSLEVKVRYALHLMHACSGEPIQVDSFPDGVRVRGMADTEERKRELMQALASLKEPFLSVSLRTPDQATPADLTFLEGAPATSAQSTAAESSSALPVETLLPRGPNGAAAITQDTVVKLSSDAIQSGRELLMEAWAVRRLLDRYPNLSSVSSADNRWLVEVMVRDHLVSFERHRKRVTEIVRLIQPSLAAPEALEVSPGVPQRAAHMLLENANQVNSMVLSLFARGQGSGGAETLYLLSNRLAELQDISRRLQSVFGG